MEEKILTALKSHWSDLLKEGQELGFKSGQVIAYEGHDPYGLFVLVDGKVEFSKEGVRCRGVHLWASPKGSVIGLEPFFNQIPFCCTCRAVQDCRTVFISKTQLLPLLAEDPKTSSRDSGSAS